MRILIILLPVFLNILLLVHSTAQEMPLVYEVENTGADCPIPYMPTYGELPEVEALPDPFLWSDGRGRIKNFSDWRCRRAEIAAEIQHYEVGEKPEKPENISASYNAETNTLSVDVTVNGNTLTLTSEINLPEGDGPHPAIIGMGNTSMPDSLFTNRDIAQMNFNFGQVMAWQQTRGQEPINDLYPELEYMGAYSAWPWGVSRLIDGLEIVSEELNIDTKHLAVSGCSFAGKMAIFSGAFDERIALTFGIESGGGGYTTWRYSEVITQSVETLGNTNNVWFIQDMFQFANNVDKLPMDHHELMSMVAPRALFVTGNPGWTWLADESGYVGSRAAEKVYEALGISDRFAYSQIGGHNHCAIPAQQVPEITAYLDKFLLGDDSAETNIGTTPYSTNLNPWIPWDVPALNTGSSYFGKTVLLSPADETEDTETEVIMTWEAVDGAARYYLELSEDADFSEIVQSDTTTATTKTIMGLEQGEMYYWRVRVESAAGEAGPWSDQFNFLTAIPLPGTPEPISATLVPGRDDYLTLTWSGIDFATQYQVELALDQDFENVEETEVTSNTEILIRGTEEGNTYFWRVRARNVSGDGPWSASSEITVIVTPTDLEATSSGNNQVTLSWEDESDVEDGYIIEGKAESDDSFTVLDTVVSNVSEYNHSTEGLPGGNYEYRIKAYIGTAFSAYSNVASVTITTSNDGDPGAALPDAYKLEQNYPNPFNPATQIGFALPESGYITLKVYDITGREIQTLINKSMIAGNHSVTFDAANLPSGIYFYTIQSGNFLQTRKMVLMK